MTPAYTLAITVCDTRSSSADVRVQRLHKDGTLTPADAPVRRIGVGIRALAIEADGDAVAYLRMCPRTGGVSIAHGRDVLSSFSADGSGRPRIVLALYCAPARVRTYYAENPHEWREVTMHGLPDRGVCWLEGGPEP